MFALKASTNRFVGRSGPRRRPVGKFGRERCCGKEVQRPWCSPSKAGTAIALGTSTNRPNAFANCTGDVHPIHVHQVRFQVLNRQAFDAKTYVTSGKLNYFGVPMAPETNERPAWKDTIKTYGGMITRVIAKFDLPAGVQAKPGDEFRYVWHCHVLEHEDNEMMRPYKIIA